LNVGYDGPLPNFAFNFDLRRYNKAYQQKRDAKKKNDSWFGADDDNEGLTETRVGQKLSDLTTRRVIVGVLMMLFCLPLFDITYYPAGDPSLLTEGGLKMVTTHTRNPKL
jgi:hypothetical protein